MNSDPTVKNGIQTSEFWVTVLMGVAPIMSIILKHDVTPSVQGWAFIASGVVTTAYTLSRLLVKRKALDVSASFNQTADVPAQPAVTAQTVYVQSATDTTPAPEVSVPANTEPGSASAGFPQA